MSRQDYSRDIAKYQQTISKKSIADPNRAYQRQIQSAQSAMITGAVGADPQTYTGDIANVDFSTITVKPFIPEWLYRPLYGRPRSLNIPEIRRLAKSPTPATCIKTIVDQVASVPWHIRMKDSEAAPDEAAIKEVTGRLENPNRNKEDFTIILKKLMRDMLEVDAGVIAKVYTRDSYVEGNYYQALLPLGRREMVEFYCYDGGTFTINPSPHGLLPDVNAYFQYNFHQQSMPVPFARDEITYMMGNPQTNSIYGLSPMEMCFDVIRYIIYGVTSGLDHFTRNEIPPGILSILDADTDHINEFQARLSDKVNIKDPRTEENRWVSSKVPITNQDVKFTPLTLTPEVMKLLESQQWYTKLVLACFDEETEILTDNGFKLFKDLYEKEKVAQVDKETLEITFTEPEAYQTYDFDGDMYYYKTRTCDLAVTPDHRMLCANDTKFYDGNYDWEVKQACEFSRGIIPQAGKWTGEQIDYLEFTTKNTGSRNHQETYTFNIKGDLFCKFMGIWLSDGWVQGNGDVFLCASEVYPENIQVIEYLLADMNVKYTKSETNVRANLHTTELSDNKLIKYRFANMAFHDYLSQFGKARDKFVPKNILDSTPEQIELFLEYFMYGDGSLGKHKKGRNDRYGSMSKDLMNGLQEMLIKTGKSATLYQNSSNGCWELTVRKTKTDKIKDKFYSRIIKDNLEIKKYTGKVYDVTVPTHFIVVRRNGRVSISGNCFGVTPSEIGWTDDSNRATELSQNEVFKRKTVMPALDTLEYYVNREIIPEYGYDNLYFEFIRKDIQSDLREQSLWESQLKNGQRTINEWRSEHGDLEPVTWGDEPYKGGGFMGDSNIFNSGNEGQKTEK